MGRWVSPWLVDVDGLSGWWVGGRGGWVVDAVRGWRMVLFCFTWMWGRDMPKP